MKKYIKIILSASALVGLQAYGQNLVQNPGFETGTFADWTIGGIFTGGVVGGAAHSGSYGAVLFPQFPLTASLSQNIPVNSGDEYDVSFWLASPGEFNSIAASFGGSQLLNITSSSFFFYTEFTYNDVAEGNGDLSFTFGGPGWFYLDDVSVTDVTPAGVPDFAPGFALTAATLIGLCGWAYKVRQHAA